MIFAGIYYSTQRLVKTRLASDAALEDPLLGLAGHHRRGRHHAPARLHAGKEYAELEWPIDIAIARHLGGLRDQLLLDARASAHEKHLYVAIWFYIATIVTVAVLHIVNSLAIPVFALKSYSIYGGAQDALVQWWYGHNAVAFFLTTPILGIMYYFLPEGGGAAGLLVPALHHPLLGADLPLHLGRAAPPAQHGAARLGADARA